MSISHKGTVSTVIATIVASGVILFSGNGIAENKAQVKTDPRSDSGKAAVGTTKQSIAVQNGVQKMRVSLAPPPGPFMNTSISLEKSQQIKNSLVSQKAPVQPAQILNKPVINSSNTPIWSVNSQNSNLALSYPMQQYMYVPVPMMPSSIMVPQAPVFNRMPAPLPSFRALTPTSSLPYKKDKN